MQSLIEAATKLKIQLPESKAQQAYNDALNDVIALIKQHERPVGVPQLVTLLSHAFTNADREEIERLDNQEYAELALKLLRPHLKQQQPVSASVEAALRYLFQVGYNTGQSDYALKKKYNGNAGKEYAIFETREPEASTLRALAAMQTNITAKE